MSVARYDAVADFYARGWTDQYDDDVTQCLLEMVEAVEEQAVLDVACGHGRIARELARRGARVTGVEVSGALLAKARAAEQRQPLGVDYIEADVSSDDPRWARRVFDLVVCSFGLSDIDDLDAALGRISEGLVDGGTFVFSILHPCFPGGDTVSGSWPTTGRYVDEGWWSADGAASSLRRQVGANHRTLSTYVNSLRRAGLWLARMREPPPPAEWAVTHPEAAGLPVFLVGACVGTERKTAFP